MSTLDTTSAVHDRTWAQVLGIAAAAGAAMGVAALVLSTAASPIAMLADSRAVWAVVAWALAARLGADLARGAAAGAVVMAVAAVVLFLLDPSRFLGSSGWQEALLIGALLGAAGALSQRSDASEAAWGLAAPIAVLAGALLLRVAAAVLAHRLDELLVLGLLAAAAAAAAGVALERSWPRPSVVAPALALAGPLALASAVLSSGVLNLG